PRLARRVALDLVAERRPWPDQAHVAADHVPELRQLVEREPAQHAPDPRDARVAAVDRVARALLLGSDDHRAELQQVEVHAAFADTRLAVEHRPAILELDRNRGQKENGT